jgi:hypothetical protein
MTDDEVANDSNRRMSLFQTRAEEADSLVNSLSKSITDLEKSLLSQQSQVDERC